jgi:hypothetical protein
MNRTICLLILLLLALSILAFACTPTSTPAASGKPSILLAAPAHGAEFREGETVIVQSASGDAAGIARVELSVDGALVRSDSAPSPQTYFNIVQNWNAMPGAHTLAVRVYNTRGIGSDPAAVSISVLPVATPSVTMASARAAPTPTNTVAPLRAATPTQTRLRATMPARLQEDTLYEGKQDYTCDTNACWRSAGNLNSDRDYFYPDISANNDEVRALLNSIGLLAIQVTDDREKWLRVQTVWV